MYSLAVRDHIMIAHSLQSKVFGPAQKMHGATYVVDAEFKVVSLDENNLVIDIGLASKALKKVLEEINYSNLDENETFKNTFTTTEFLCNFIHARLAKRMKDEAIFNGIIKITLHESHIAWASYESEI